MNSYEKNDDGSSIRLLPLFVCLLVASIASCGLIWFQMYYTGIRYESKAFTFLLWNLFLAWLPFIFAWLLYEYCQRMDVGKSKLIIFVLWFLWFIFYPNAHYLVTDFIHFNRLRGPISEWYDLIVLMSFAWTGYFLGFISLYLQQRLLHRRYGWKVSWVYAGMMLLLGGFGVYLGRFLRWNSWDLLTRPIELVSDSWRMIMSAPQPLLFSILFGCFLGITHVVLYVFLHIRKTI